MAIVEADSFGGNDMNTAGKERGVMLLNTVLFLWMHAATKMRQWLRTSLNAIILYFIKLYFCQARVGRLSIDSVVLLCCSPTSALK